MNKPERSLPDAMGYLLPSSATSDWSATVHRAAQLAAPYWDQPLPAWGESLKDDDLRAMTGILYTLGVEQGVSPHEVPLDSVREALKDDVISGEPREPGRRVVNALDALREHGWGEAFWKMWVRLKWSFGPDVGLMSGDSAGDALPQPSELYQSVTRLRSVVRDLTQEATHHLPPPPEPTGQLGIRTASQPRLAGFGPEAEQYARLILCHCDDPRDNVLHVDGLLVTFEWVSGHTRKLDDCVEVARMRVDTPVEKRQVFAISEGEPTGPYPRTYIWFAG
jgi:hypothetical protein